MMKQNELVPKRRFKGFNDEWKVNSFNDLLDEIEGIRRGPFGSALKKEYFIPHSNYVVYEQQNAIYDRYQTRYYITKQKYEELSRFSINENDFIMSGAGTIGRISKVPKGIKKGVINQALIRIRVNKKIVDSNYFLQWMRSEDMQNKLTLANPASAMVNLVPMSEVKGWQIKVPSIEEQQKIGEIFKHLDEMIALQQRKLDKTKALKSAYLAEMFPSEGERVPKRRFEGFTGEWEEYKLSDLAEISTGKAFSSIDFDDKGEYYVVTNKNIQDQSISIESVGSRINISEKLVLDNYVLRGNNILITMDGNVGRVGKYSDDNAVLAQRVARLNSKQFEFVYQITRKSQFISKMNEVSVGNIIKHISLKQISDYLFMAPKDKKEQQKIGEFFKQIDEMIALQQQKLEKFKATKQAYLHEMFV